MDISLAPIGFSGAGADLAVPTQRQLPSPDGASPAPDPAASGAPPVSPGVIAAAVQSSNKVLQARGNALEFQVDDRSHQAVVKIVDTETNKVIRQIPNEEFLRIAQGIDEFQARLIHDKA